MRNLTTHPITRNERQAAVELLAASYAGEACYSPETLDLCRWKIRNYFPICGQCGLTFSARHTCG